MGRDRRNERRAEHFTKMIRSSMETPAWRALSAAAQALYPWLKLEWRGPEANNNGKIKLSVRQAADRLGMGINTAARAFHDLQAKGFIFVTEPARLGFGGDAKSPSFEITELAMPGGGPDGRKLYRQWREGEDFAVYKATIHNPSGTRKKQNPVIKLVTSRHRIGDV